MATLDQLLSGGLTPQIADPAARIMAEVMGPIRQALALRQRPEPEYTPDELGSALRTLTGGVMSGVEGVGNVLDTPGGMARSALIGQNPFSTVFDPASRPTGRQVLEHYGLLGPNTPGFDWGDVAGLGAEIVTDPLMLVSGPGAALTKAGRQATRAGKILGASPSAMIREIREGQRGLLALELPGLPFLHPERTPLAVFGAGSQRGAAALDAAYYGRLSPLRPMRALFDHRTAGLLAGGHQRHADMVHSEMVNWRGELGELGQSVAAKAEEAKKLYGELTANSDPDVFDDAFRRLVERGGQINLEDAAKVFEGVAAQADPVKLQQATVAFHELADTIRTVDDMTGAELKSLGLPLQDLVDSFVRHIPRRAGGGYATKKYQAQMASTYFPFALGRNDVLRNIPDGTAKINLFTADPLFTASKQNRQVHETLLEEAMKQAGVLPAKGRLKDVTPEQRLAFLTREMADRYDLPNIWRYDELLQKEFVEQGQGWAQGLTPAQFASQLQQKLLQQDPDGYAWAQGLDPAAFAKQLAESPQNPMKGKFRTESDLEQLVGYLAGLPAEVLMGGEKRQPLGVFNTLKEANAYAGGLGAGGPGARGTSVVQRGKKFYVTRPGGLFNRGVVTDQLDYLMHAAKVKSSLVTMRNMFADPTIVSRAALGEAGENLATLWVNKLRLDPQGLMPILKAHGIDATDALDAVQKAGTLNVAADAAAAAGKVLKATMDPGSLGPIMEAYDQFNSLFKALNTSIFPAFHGRNLLSGQWANWAAGMFGLRSVRDVLRALRGKAPADMGGLMDEIRAHNVLGAGGWMLDEATGSAREGLPKGGAFRALFDVAGEGAREAARDPKQFVKDQFKIRGSWGGGGSQSGNLLARYGERLHEVVEYVNRVAPYIELRRRGWTPAQAARKVKLTQFDYSELSDFERQVMKRLVPFYGFMKKNLPHQLKMLIDNPGGRTAQTLRAVNTLRDEDSGYTPSWLAEGLAIRLPGGARDPNTESFINSTSLLPIEEAFNRFPIANGRLDGGRMLEKLAANTNMLLQAPLQTMTGKQLWSGRRLNELHEFPTGNPDVDFLVANSPFSRISSTIRTWRDPRKTKAAKLLNTAIGGVRQTDVDVERSLSIEGRQILEKLLRDKPHVRELTKVFVRPEDLPNLDEETVRELSLYQALMEQLRRMNRERATAQGG